MTSRGQLGRSARGAGLLTRPSPERRRGPCRRGRGGWPGVLLGREGSILLMGGSQRAVGSLSSGKQRISFSLHAWWSLVDCLDVSGFSSGFIWKLEIERCARFTFLPPSPTGRGTPRCPTRCLTRLGRLGQPQLLATLLWCQLKMDDVRVAPGDRPHLRRRARLCYL